MAARRIGELLVAEGLISEAVIDRAVSFQRLTGEPIRLGTILLKWDLLAEASLLDTLGKIYGCAPVDWATLSAASVEVVRLLPASHAIRLSAIPFAAEKGVVRVALANPSNLAAIDEICAIVRRRVISAVTTEARLLQAHQRFYGRSVPLEFRSVLQKLDRKSAESRKPPQSRAALDFRGQLDPPDHGSPKPLDAPFPQKSAALPAVSIPVTPEPIPPAPKPPVFSAETTQTTLPERTDPSLDSPSPERPLAIPFGEDSLTGWVGDALASFARASQSPPSGIAAPEPTAFRPEGIPATSPTPAPISSPRDTGKVLKSSPPSDSTDLVEDMWRSAPPNPVAEEIADGMWTETDPEPAPVPWEARNRDEIGDAALGDALTDMPRVLLLGVGRDAIVGWKGRGPGFLPEQIAAIRIPPGGESVFARVRSSGVPHFGPLDREEWPRPFRQLFGDRPPDCAVFPVRVLDSVAAFLYADRVGEPMRYEDFARVARAAASTASLLSRFLLPRSATPVG